MESYTYLFLFVLQLVFTVVVLLALLYERRLQKQLEKKNKLLLAELSRRDSSNDKHTLHVHREDSTHIRINYDSLGRIKEIDFSNRKTEKRTGKNQSSSFQDHKEVTSQQETTVTRKSDVKQQSQEKEKTTNGCSLWTFLKFMFFFLSFCLVHDNWGRIKNFIRRLWKK